MKEILTQVALATLDAVLFFVGRKRKKNKPPEEETPTETNIDNHLN